MFVFRIEHTKTKLGPYCCSTSDVARIVDQRYSSFKKHPGPYGDLKLTPQWKTIRSNHNSYLFGFSSITQMREWFHGGSDIVIFGNCGFQLVVYDAEEVLEGNFQVVFNRNTAKIVNTLDLLTVAREHYGYTGPDVPEDDDEDTSVEVSLTPTSTVSMPEAAYVTYNPALTNEYIAYTVDVTEATEDNQSVTWTATDAIEQEANTLCSISCADSISSVRPHEDST